LVVLAEGPDRRVRLDDLELQLALTAYETPELAGMFEMTASATVRYGGGCRDVSTVLAEDVVATLSGIASQHLKSRLDAPSPSIAVWHLCEQSLTVSRASVPAESTIVRRAGGWQVRLSPHAKRLMRAFRARKLPSETGGVMLGRMDVGAKTVYVVGALGSPCDSVEWPDLYVRGVKGLARAVEEVKRRTGGHVEYVGEWHSHPDRCSSRPSEDDKEAHRWLVERMAATGHPGLLAIQGQHHRPHFMLSSGSSH